MAEIPDIARYLAPIRKSVTVSRPAAEAFEIFTAGLSAWWPHGRYSIHGAELATCAMEPRAGGEVYEVSKAGNRAVWGTLLLWEPPHRFVMTWHPGRPAEGAQEVEVRFSPVEGGTRVELEHRGWERLGDRAEAARKGYDGGWDEVFGTCFVDACR